jgi:hypothetical protein
MDPRREWMWTTRFHELVEYKRAHGHCNVTRKGGPSLELGRWVGQQRVARQKNKLIGDREAKLNAIGFVWKVRCLKKSRMGFSKTSWDTRFEQLEEYKKAKGDCNVSQNDSEQIELGRWIAAQRQSKKRALLSDERVAKMDSIGFVWNIRKVHPRLFSLKQVDWNVRFRQLLAYNLAVGDCDIPQNFLPNPQLGRWVQTQRLANKNKTLTKERWEKLNSIGFDWGKHGPSGAYYNGSASFSGNNPPQQLRKLETEQPHAHFNANRQKEVQEKQSLAELETSTDNNWDAHFRELLAYLQTHDDCNVPQSNPHNPLLARWVSEQRNDYDLKRRGRQTSLTPLREAKLDAIGFTWFVEDTPAAEAVFSAVRPEETRSEHEVKSENVGVAASCPDHITSG